MPRRRNHVGAILSANSRLPVEIRPQSGSLFVTKVRILTIGTINIWNVFHKILLFQFARLWVFNAVIGTPLGERYTMPRDLRSFRQISRSGGFGSAPFGTWWRRKTKVEGIRKLKRQIQNIHAQRWRKLGVDIHTYNNMIVLFKTPILPNRSRNTNQAPAF